VALTPTIYRAVIALADVDGGRYERLSVTVARHPSETAERLVARLLAFALCYEEGLVFTRGIAAGDEPDLWSMLPDGRVDLWVEVGLPEAERLIKAARHARRVILCASGAQRWRWETQQLPRLAAVANLTVLGLAPELVDGLVQRLERGIDWSLTISGAALYLAVGDTTMTAPLEQLKAPAA
jgi:uncharacterized protein YaeQ